MKSLHDATVVITGASSRKGLATARAFAQHGANVVLAARRRELFEEAVRDCEALDGRSLAVPTDVTDPDQVRELASAAASAFGGIDVWLNNAGSSMWGPFEEIPVESQARLIELNLLGAIYGCHAALSYFFDRGGRGVILNVSSIFGRVPMPWAASYSASKAGLAGFTEALRFELASRFGIDVCGVYPAYVDTPTYRNSANYTLELYVRLSVVGVHLSTVPDGGLGEAPTPRRRIAILRELRHETVRKVPEAPETRAHKAPKPSHSARLDPIHGPCSRPERRPNPFSDSFMTEL